MNRPDLVETMTNLVNSGVRDTNNLPQNLLRYYEIINEHECIEKMVEDMVDLIDDDHIGNWCLLVVLNDNGIIVSFNMITMRLCLFLVLHGNFI